MESIFNVSPISINHFNKYTEKGCTHIAIVEERHSSEQALLQIDEVYPIEGYTNEQYKSVRQAFSRRGHFKLGFGYVTKDKLPSILLLTKPHNL